ncbi:MAG: polyprenyl diphosphate synthase [Candidatus Syntropharchaeia archaeon]
MFLGILYRIYEKLLRNEILENPLPTHVAIIMDGNRRFAERIGKARYMGHLYGAETTEKVIDWTFDLGIKRLTLYAFSIENFERSNEEKKRLFSLMCEKFEKICVDERFHKNKVRVYVIGDVKSLPEDLRNAIKKAEKATEKYDQYQLYVALAYSGRQEIVDAARKIAEKIKIGEISVEDVDEEIISNHLYMDPLLPHVDLIIRTGGEVRTSNFLPWQANGSECAAYFTAPFWPEFRKIDFLRAVRTYQMRELERKRNLVLRLMKLLKENKKETEDIFTLSKKIGGITKKEVLRFLS